MQLCTVQYVYKAIYPDECKTLNGRKVPALIYLGNKLGDIETSAVLPELDSFFGCNNEKRTAEIFPRCRSEQGNCSERQEALLQCKPHCVQMAQFLAF